MNFPLNPEIGPVTINTHLVMELAGFFFGFRFFVWLRKGKEDPVNQWTRLWVIVGATAGALIGSRLLGGLEDPQAFFSGENGLIWYYRNKTIVGGLLGGLFGVELTKLILKEKKSTGDLFVYPLILAMILGRIGCFSAGITEPTYGIETQFFAGMDLGDGLKRHPTALYEILFLGVLWVLFWWISTKINLKNGAGFKLFMIAYLLFRLFVDFIKPGNPIWLNITAIQWACIFGLLYYVRIFLQPKQQLIKTPDGTKA